jgi:hypothetical protein
LSRGGVSEFVSLDAGKEEVKQVRHQQHGFGQLEQRRARLFQCQELKKGIEAQELQAGQLENTLPGHSLECKFRHSFGVGVAVMPGIAKQDVATTKQGKIDAPGIHAYRVDPAVFVRAAPKGGQDFGIQSENIPVPGINGAHRKVGEPVDYLQLHFLPIESAQHSPSAFSAQINGQQSFRHRVSFYDRRQARSQYLIMKIGRGPNAVPGCLGSLLVARHDKWAYHGRVLEQRTCLHALTGAG